MRYLILPLLLALVAGCSEPAEDTATAADAVTPTPQGDPVAGRQTAETCAECHGIDGTPRKAGVPSLAGQDPDYLRSALAAYRDASRSHPDMSRNAAALSDWETANVVAYYAGLERPAMAAGSTADNATTPDISSKLAACAGCHGADGNPAAPGNPRLAGLEPAYLAAALKAYRDGQRQDPLMPAMVAGLSEEDIEAMAAHYAVQAPRATSVAAQGDAERGAAAAAACAGCHGADGNSSLPDTPTLAGQDPGYLATALAAYADGRRPHPVMAGLAQGLDSATMQDVAAFYATQQPAAPAGTAPDEEPAVTAAPEDAAEAPAVPAAVAGCNSCHGADGNVPLPGNPRLSGLHPDYLLAAMGAYRDGERQDPVMAGLVAPLSDAELERIAYHYATRQPSALAAPAGGDADKGRTAAVACASCHGEDGNSPSAANPSLAGQEPGYLVKALEAYAAGRRSHAAMQGLAQGLDATTMQDLAAFYASQTPVAPEVRMPLTTAQWAARCDRCHGVDGVGGIGDFPRIAGQPVDYLVKALSAYQSGERQHSTMHAMAAVLSAADIEGLAAYYAER